MWGAARARPARSSKEPEGEQPDPRFVTNCAQLSRIVLPLKNASKEAIARAPTCPHTSSHVKVTMQALAAQGSTARVKPFGQAARPSSRTRAVAVRAQQQQQQPAVSAPLAAAAVLAASCMCGPALAATELVQPAVDVTVAVGSAGAVAGLGALLVATDPQKRCARRAAALPARPHRMLHAAAAA